MSVKVTKISIGFDDNTALVELFGIQDSHLKLLEKLLKVKINARGNEVIVSGPSSKAIIAEDVLRQIYKIIKNKHSISESDFKYAVDLISHNKKIDLLSVFDDDIDIPSREKPIKSRTAGQREYIKKIYKNDVVLSIGPAGTGKTYLACAVAVSMLIKRKFKRIVLARPAVEAGEKLGFLPGDMVEKVNPYLRPLYDALYDMLDVSKVEEMIANDIIEIAPIAFMRGRTLNNSFIIIDEAQNTTYQQMKMCLTRLGFNSKMVVTGDITQIDLPKENKSGLLEAFKILNKVEGIGLHSLSEKDIVRHPLVTEIVKAYEKIEKK